MIASVPGHCILVTFACPYPHQCVFYVDQARIIMFVKQVARC